MTQFMVICEKFMHNSLIIPLKDSEQVGVLLQIPLLSLGFEIGLRPYQLIVLYFCGYSR